MMCASEFEEVANSFEGDSVFGVCSAAKDHGYDRLPVPNSSCVQLGVLLLAVQTRQFCSMAGN